MRKFVTYINLYNEEDEKIRNVGFGKFSIDRERCKMEIHMKNIGFKDQKCMLYLFARRGELLLGMDVGVVNIQNGAGDFRKIVDMEEVTKQKVAMRDVQGFLLFSTEGQMIASQWGEGEIRRNRFEVWKLEEPEETKLEIIEESEQENELEKVEEPEQAEELAKLEEPKQAEELAKLKEPEQVEELEKSKEPDQAEQLEKEEVAEQVNVQSTGLPMPDLSRILQAAEGLRTAMMQKEPEKERTLTMQKESERPGQKPQTAPAWQCLWENYGIQKPFAGRDHISCVQIQLKDIKLLPEEYWYLGNNNFLLHGFCNYRYLLFGRMQEEEGEKYFLGIPGIYQNQEHVMASIFGFPEFIPEEASSYNTGKFGVWYRFIRL